MNLSENEPLDGQHPSGGRNILIRGVSIALPDRIIESGYLRIRNGIIHGFGSLEGDEHASALPGESVLELSGRIISPGLMELHIHGAGGFGFDSIKGPGDLLAVRDFLRKHGVTTFVPTILCDETAITNLVAAIEESGLPDSVVPGIYIEGPFVNLKRRGGIQASLVRDPDPAYLAHILELGKGRIRIMTVAPELAGIEAIYRMLAEAGVRISLGHSDCDISTCPLPEVPFSVTHLFNAMSGIAHRQPGLANLPFSDSRCWVELNADSVHVNRECMRLTASALAPGRLVLTSDAVVAAGLAYGSFLYFGHQVISGQDGVRYAAGGTLMGSNRLGMGIIRSFLAATQAAPDYALRAMTDTPARIAGIGHLRGRIERGLAADLVSWAPGFTDPAIYDAAAGEFRHA